MGKPRGHPTPRSLPKRTLGQRLSLSAEERGENFGEGEGRRILHFPVAPLKLIALVDPAEELSDNRAGVDCTPILLQLPRHGLEAVGERFDPLLRPHLGADEGVVNLIVAGHGLVLVLCSQDGPGFQRCGGGEDPSPKFWLDVEEDDGACPPILVMGEGSYSPRSGRSTHTTRSP